MTGRQIGVKLTPIMLEEGMERYDNRSLSNVRLSEEVEPTYVIFLIKKYLIRVNSIRPRSLQFHRHWSTRRYASGYNLRLIGRNFQKTRDIRMYTEIGACHGRTKIARYKWRSACRWRIERLESRYSRTSFRTHVCVARSANMENNFTRMRSEIIRKYGDFFFTSHNISRLFIRN